MSGHGQFSMSEHERRVHEVLGASYGRNGDAIEAVDNRTPFDALLAKEDSERTADENFTRIETIRAVFRELFRDGNHPARVMWNVYCIAKAFDVELLRGLSLEQIGIIFGKTRQAASARVNLLITRRLEKRGYKRTHVSFQKTETARARMSAAQMGNHNRARSVRRKAA